MTIQIIIPYGVYASSGPRPESTPPDPEKQTPEIRPVTPPSEYTEPRAPRPDSTPDVGSPGVGSQEPQP
jgi:hypothetical protein